ncbi:hypothetical protein [Plebeiibacterium sediminum]|uniref:Uncharacterized protein n=1 Tax=Plebeiibacterium sediminum TaxID=2992112 RepID=A0AAE3SE41_9BACT|nr:hypothetical protein [Plebeiobacterium sediminum]MCW3785582.1 hypothetical protein [Plebeiobacterium sediminum]
MKKTLLLIFQIIISSYCFGQNRLQYKSLDDSNPIQFKGKSIIYQGSEITLGPKAFFIDGQLSDEEVNQHPFVYNSINKAAKDLTQGTEEEPMVLYIAPWVYWIDNPDDSEIRTKGNDPVPYGLKIDCDWLRFFGLTNNPENVVLACNRGQTMGATGNFTMFRFSGDGTSSENITYGNYCNVDLNFPLNPALNRKKRGDAIVQAQLIHCNGDKIVARNTHFISRLNLCNFIGAKRILFDRCHMECTDDALCGTGVYLNCTFNFFSSKPFYNTVQTGSVFLNCDINSVTHGNQYFTKANGQVAVIDTRINGDNVKYVGWRDNPPHEMKNYQYNVSLNSKPIIISENDPATTINITNLPILNAYRIQLEDTVIYNTYNLLKGNDDWDPCGIKEKVLQAEKLHHKKYTDLPTQIRIPSSRNTIETDREAISLGAIVNRFGSYPIENAKLTWFVASEDSSIVKLIPSSNTLSCKVIATNNNDNIEEVILHATNDLGLEAASVVMVSPLKLEAPNFTKFPELSKPSKGIITIDYTLDMEYEDESIITWYRCDNKEGRHPIEVMVSRLKEPLKIYDLSSADIGYYIMATVAPKHLRCEPGKAIKVITRKPVSSKNIVSNDLSYSTDFKNVSVKNQFQIIPGFWTFRPLETIKDGQIIPADTTKNAWYYGKGYEGNANMSGLLQTGRSATMLYTPSKNTCTNMQLKMTVSPFKTAGQGFSVAPLYMDILIKFDNKNMSGYGLRFIRTTKYGNAVDCYFVKYENNEVKQISEAVTTSCFRSPCLIDLKVDGNQLTAHVSTTKKYPAYTKHPEIVPEVNIKTAIDNTPFSGFGIQYNGGSTTMINKVDAQWE